jgi:hypothetical protein
MMTLNNPPKEAPVKVPKKRGRKRKNKKYFTDITEIAICAYNGLDEDDQRKKDKIYNRFIYKPFYKLAEIVYNTGSYPYINLSVEDIKAEMIAHMTEKLFMYKPGKGKAFSYFNRMVKNELIQRNDKAYKKVKVTTDVTEMDKSRDILTEQAYNDLLTDQQEFMEIYIDYVDKNLGTLFNNRRDIAIADSMLEIFRNRKLIEVYNKKALYVLVRERSRSEQQYVTKVVNQLKLIWNKHFAEFVKHGKMNIEKNNDFFL